MSQDMRCSQGAGSEVISFLAPRLRRLLESLPEGTKAALEEIRLRQGRPLVLRAGEEDFTVLPFDFSPFSGSRGSGEAQLRLSSDLAKGWRVEKEDVEKTLQIISQNSLYALEEELRNGFVTLPGGHRVGMVGQAVIEKGRVRTLKHIAGLNFRIGREIKGAADGLLPYLISAGRERVYNTLLVSPPRGGKTTLLRDVVRQLSNGVPALGIKGFTVGVADERSEIAGCYQGVPQRDVGMRTDVLDRCPKAEGMLMLLRSMAPQIIAVDELGKQEEREALEEALNAGVTVIATVHAASLSDLDRRPVVRELVAQRVFERIVILGRSRGPGTIETVWDGKKRCFLKGGEENAQAAGSSAGDRSRTVYRPGVCRPVSPAP